MQCVRPNFSAARATSRSRISNRSRLLPGVDGRSATARRFRDICRSYEAEAGGDVSEVERDLTRVAGVEANVELGLKLVELRSRIKGNRDFGRAVRAQFDIDAMRAVEYARVAKAYGERPDIYRRLSWNALVLLSSPTMPPSVRRDLEARILAGESIGGPDIVRARGALKTGRPKRPADQPARMPA